MADKKTFSIYLIVSPELKMYVGMTHDVSRRFAEYKKIAASAADNAQRELSTSLRLYGWDAHETSILRSAISSRSEAFVWERYYIHKLDTFLTDHGLNLTRGGDGVDNWTDERREEHAESMREMMLGGSNPMRNPKHVETMRKACRAEEYRTNHSEIMAKIYADKETHHLDLAVVQKALDGEYLATYESIRKAAEATGSRTTKISDCINGRRKTHNGYLWEKA